MPETTDRKNENIPVPTDSKPNTEAAVRAIREVRSGLRSREAGAFTDDLGKLSLFVCDCKLTRTQRQQVFVFLSTGRYDHESCVYGPGDLPWIIRSPSLFANTFDSTDPLVVTCLERWHRLRALRQAEAPVEPHWHFPRDSHFNGRLSR